MTMVVIVYVILYCIALLECGADPNLFGAKKCSPLMTCILNNDVTGTLSLLQHGAALDHSVDTAGTYKLSLLPSAGREMSSSSPATG